MNIRIFGAVAVLSLVVIALFLQGPGVGVLRQAVYFLIGSGLIIMAASKLIAPYIPSGLVKGLQFDQFNLTEKKWEKWSRGEIIGAIIIISVVAMIWVVATSILDTHLEKQTSVCEYFRGGILICGHFRYAKS